MTDDLSDRLHKAVADFAALSPVEQALMTADQRRSWVRGQTGRDPGEDVLAAEVRRLREQLAAAPRAGVVESEDWVHVPARLLVFHQRLAELLAGGGPHEWGYRDVTDGTFIVDSAPFELAERLEEIRQAAAPPAVPDPHAELVGAAVKYRDINRNGSGVGWAARRSKAVLELISAADRLIETNTVSAVNIDTPPNK